MQMTGPKLYSGPIDCAKKIVAVRGWQGLWHGFGATLLFRSHMGTMYVPMGACARPAWDPRTDAVGREPLRAYRFLSYELIQRAFKRYSPDMNPGTANFLSGGLASNAFWISSFPFDAVKKCVRAHVEGLIASFRRAVADMWLNLAHSRLMTDSLTNPKYKSWMMCARAMWAEGGARVRVLPLFLLLRLE